MKVLLTSVGRQDPYSGKTLKEGPIVTLIRSIRPSIVCMFPSANIPQVKSSTEQQAFDTRDWIQSELKSDIKIFIRPLPLFDPTDYTQILREGEREIRLFIDSLPEDEEHEFYLNTSSGTPQIGAAFLLWANSGFVPRARVMQVGNPEYAESRVHEINIDFIEEVNLRNRATRYFEQGMYLVAAQELERLSEISLNSARKLQSQLLAKILHAYHQWDLIQYKDALQRLSSVVNKYGNAQDLADAMNVLDSQVDYLKKLASEETNETPHNLVDLYYNAKRRFLREDYTDTLARFWRIYEGSLFYLLRDTYKLEPRNLKDSKSKENLRSVRRACSRLNQSSYVDMTIAKRLLIDVFHDPLVKRLSETKVETSHEISTEIARLDGVLEKLRDYRNQSIVAHGMKPVERKYACWSLEAGRNLIEIVLAEHGKTLLCDYPFAQSRMEPILEWIRTL